MMVRAVFGLCCLWFVGACGGHCAVAAPSRTAAEAPAPVPQVAQADAAVAQPIRQPADAIVYRAAPPSMPAGVEMAVLEGDPRQAGMFTIRLKAPAGFALPPHTHPVDERVTVLSGSISVGFGESVARDQARAFTAGSFYVNPPNVPHFVFSDEGAVVQITGMGPWRVEVLSLSRP